jgi:hypothetical protein
VIWPAEYEALASAIVGGAEERYVAAILERLTTSLVSGGQLQAQNWRDIERLAQSNHAALTDLSIRYRTQIASQTQQAVTGALSASAASDLAVLSKLYPSVVPKATTELFGRISAQSVKGVQQMIARQNLAMSKAAERTWYEVAGEAVTSWNHSAATRDSIMTQAVKRLSSEGVQFIDYTFGRRTTIDAALRRTMTAQINEASGRITESYLDEFDHDLVMTSAHFGARPEHEVWQGKAYCRSGRKTIDGVTYPDFAQATGYGDVAGLAGINCNHSHGPYYPGISELPEIEQERNGMTSAEYYKATQQQRGLERQIRDKKREIALGQEAGLPMTQERLELGTLQNRLKGFTDSRGLVRQPAREKAYGVGAQPRGLRGSAKTVQHSSVATYGALDPGGIRALQQQSDKTFKLLTGSKSERFTEKGVIHNYTTGLHKQLNPYLYGKSNVPGGAAQALERDARLIDSAMGKFELGEDITVFSGTNAKHYADWAVGDERSIAAYLSTSVSEQGNYKAQHFYNQAKDPLMLEIRVPKGTQSLYIGDNTSFHHPEDEFLLARGLNYRVVERTGTRLILEVIS